MSTKTKLYYGWWLVLACLLIQAIGAGTTTYLYSVFANEFEVAFSANRATIMLGLTGMNVGVALAAPKLGHLLDRLSIRNIMIASGIILGSGFLLMSFSFAVWNVVVIYTLFISVGISALVLIASPALLSRWFVRYRGLAIGIAALGTQFGGFTIPPAVAALIEAFDWRFAMRAVGLFAILGVTLLAWLAIVNRPEDRGLYPDGDASAKPADASAVRRAAAVAHITLVEIFRNRNYWVGTFGLALMYGMVNMALANLAIFATDIGTDREQAALLISVFALVGMIASPTVGRFSDVADIRLLLASMLVCSAAGLATYVFADTFLSLAVATAIIAIPGGALIPITGALAGRLFDISIYARVFGAITLFTMTFAALSPIISGWVFDVTGSYRLLFIVFVGLLLLAAVMTTLIRPEAKLEPETT